MLLVSLTDIVLSGFLSGLLSAVPSKIIDSYEFWRLLSFVFVQDNIFSLIVFVMTFAFAYPGLENFFNSKILKFIMIPVISLQAILYTLIFWQSNVPMTSPLGVSFFIMYLMLFFIPNDKIKLPKLPEINTKQFVILASGFWMIFKITESFDQSFSTILQSHFEFLYGVSFAFFTFLQVKFINRFLIKKDDPVVKIDIPPAEDLKMAYISEEVRSSANENKSAPDERRFLQLTDDPRKNEEILDNILEKISQFGQDALAPDEKKFLDDYSNSL